MLWWEHLHEKITQPNFVIGNSGATKSEKEDWRYWVERKLNGTYPPFYREMPQNADGLWESIMQTILLNLLGSFNSLVYVGIDRMPIKLDYIISVLSLVKVKCAK